MKKYIWVENFKPFLDHNKIEFTELSNCPAAASRAIPIAKKKGNIFPDKAQIFVGKYSFKMFW